MLNSSDLEGEVDHSFFDSDCDDGSLCRDGGKTTEKGLEAEKDSLAAHERLHAKQTKNTKTTQSPRMEETKIMPDENHNSSRAKTKESKCQKEEEPNGTSSVSSVDCTLEKVIHDCFKDEENSTLDSKRPKGTFMALLAEASERDCPDRYSPNESEEELLLSSPNHTGAKGRKKQSSKKHVRKRSTRSPSLTSSEASVDTSSESSCSSSKTRGSTHSSILPSPNTSSISTSVRKTRVDSAGSRDVPASHAEESDDTVTDVSSLSSPDSSLLQSLDPNQSEEEEGSLKEEQRESVLSSVPGDIHQDDDSDAVDACSLRSESQLGDKLVFHYSGGRNRRNYSFTNDEVRSIDQENQRLLRQLSRLSAGSRPASTVGKKPREASNSPGIRVSHSALNRQREQKRVERENLAFLKKLESVKPTRDLRRSDQLADYQRLVTYGARLFPICESTTKKGSSTCKTPSGSRSISSAQDTLREVSTTDSRKAYRSKTLSTARPAWS